MKGAVLARVESIRLGHSERALVHAVDDDGRELKLEVPQDSVHGLVAGSELVLLIAWSLHTLPRVAEPEAAAPAPLAEPAPAAETTSASATDDEFMVLLSGARSPAALAQAPAPAKSTDFAELFGLHRSGGPRRS